MDSEMIEMINEMDSTIKKCVEINNKIILKHNDFIKTEFKEVIDKIKENNFTTIDEIKEDYLFYNKNQEYYVALKLLFNDVFDIKSNKLIDFNFEGFDYYSKKKYQQNISFRKGSISSKADYNERRTAISPYYIVSGYLKYKELQNKMIEVAKDEDSKDKLKVLFDFINILSNRKSVSNNFQIDKEIEISESKDTYSKERYLISKNLIKLNEIRTDNSTILFNYTDESGGQRTKSYEFSYILKDKEINNSISFDISLLHNLKDILKPILLDHIEKYSIVNLDFLNKYNKFVKLLNPYRLLSAI